MDELYREIAVLERKVDRLYDIVVKLDRQMGELILQEQHRVEEIAQTTPVNSQTPLVARSPIDPLMQHKDILLDGSEYDSPPDWESYKNVSPELQIRRLTAQVTAAYSRIASLEEQLLARRVPSHS